MSQNEAVETAVASAQEKIAAAAGIAPEHVRISVEHPIFGSRELTHEGASENTSAPEPKAETPETPETDDSSPEKTDEQKADLQKIAQAKAGANKSASESEPAGEKSRETCPDCGKEGLKGQQGLAAHSRFCDGQESAGEGEPASEESAHEGAWADLSEAEKAKLRESEDTEVVNELCDSAGDHVDAKGRCPAKRANGERCEYGRKGFETLFCQRHHNSADPSIHADAL